MPRYIDADALLSKLPDDLPCTASVKRVLMQAQEADVVPKSEVDKLRQRAFEQGKRDNVYGLTAEELAQKAECLSIELEAMRTAANAYKVRCDSIIQDIAKACAPHNHHLNSLDFEIGYITAMNQVIAQLEEIKKKYTEEGGLYAMC